MNIFIHLFCRKAQILGNKVISIIVCILYVCSNNIEKCVLIKIDDAEEWTWFLKVGSFCNTVNTH